MPKASLGEAGRSNASFPIKNPYFSATALPAKAQPLAPHTAANAMGVQKVRKSLGILAVTVVANVGSTHGVMCEA